MSEQKPKISGIKEASSDSGKATGQMERIVAAAIMQDGIVYTGTRHGFIIRDIHLMTGIKPVDGQQGFVTSKGEFVSREIAADIAARSGQMPCKVVRLFSEDVWDIPSGLEFNEKELTALLTQNSPSSDIEKVQGPMGLSLLLDQIEQHYTLAAQYDDAETTWASCRDVPALVKALRYMRQHALRPKLTSQFDAELVQLLTAQDDPSMSRR